MTIEGVGETSSLADALSLFKFSLCLPVRFEICDANYLAAAFRRLLHALQYFGQVVPSVTGDLSYRLRLFAIDIISSAA